MRQVVHSYRTGAIDVLAVPRPRAGAGELVVANEVSIVSSGTERMLVSFGAAGLLGKLRREPARAQQVVNKVLTDGIAPTVEAVRAKLEQPTPLGYSSAGIVIEVGAGVEGFEVGDRVATNGSHAEVVRVQADRAARVPDGVPFEDAAFTALAAVALRALQEADVVAGDFVAVLGLGVIGRLAARIAVAHGCRVLAFDPSEARAFEEAGISATSSADTFAATVAHRTGARGVDAVLVAANVGGASPDPIAHAEEIARFRGRIVLVGGGDPTLDRRQFYAKELRFSVSHSYGGRPEFETVLGLMADGRLEVGSLAAEQFAIDQAAEAYAELRRGEVPGALSFRYERRVDAQDFVAVEAPPRESKPGAPVVGVIGAGNYAQRILLPALREQGATLQTIASSGGLSATLAAREFGFAASTTDIDRILEDPAVQVVFVLTRHDAHAAIAARALRAGKSVWVEKPVAIRPKELDEVERAWREREVGAIAMGGFNRRFAPASMALRSRLGPGPKVINYQVHAGVLPADHWLLDPAVGGGRFVGEAIHFVDLVRYLVGHPLEELTAALVDAQSGTLTARFADGSVATIQYVANRSTRLPKESIEVFDAGTIYRVENFRRLDVYGGADSWLQRGRARLTGPSGMFARQDKGHAAAVRAFLDAVQTGGPSPVPFNETLEVSRALFDALGVR